jgi:DNA (cytosine-5)-methyltransferase 1
MTKILNLYAGIGGNRALWTDCEVTAVEADAEIAAVYSKLYPEDSVLVTDAHTFLEEHYDEYDFIWASPPCSSHGQYRHNVGVLGKGFRPLMPGMKLYAEIVFLQTYFKGRFCVENVKPYYEPLIKPTIELQRHLFWTNFAVKHRDFASAKIRSSNKLSDFEGHEILVDSGISNKRQVLRNRVNPELGKHILDEARKES